MLAGQGSEWETGVPYGVLASALGDHLAALSQPDLDRLGESLETELSAVLPGLAAMEPAARGERLEAERYLTHRALRELLARLAARRPVVLVLDDLHWADGETLELVGHLVRQPPAQMLLALAFRPGQLPRASMASIEQAGREDRCQLLQLEPLDERESAELLRDGLGVEQRTRLVREAAGNPFFLEQLARGAGADPPSGQGARERVPNVPPAVLAAIESELAALDPPARRLLEGGAVAGVPFEIGVAAAAAGLPGDEALAALDTLLASDLVRTTDSPRRFDFRHPLVRHAVYRSQGAGRLLGAHARVAAALRERGAPLGRIAEHVELSAGPGDEEAIATLLEAGHAAAPLAPATAARLFESALELLPEGASDRRLETLVSLATSQGAAGRLEEARTTLWHVLRDLPAERHDLRARAATFMARADHALGRQGQARALLEQTLAELPDQRSPAAALVLLELVMEHLFTADFEAMAERVEAALELARDLGDPLLEAAALAGVAHAAQNSGDIPTSHAAAERAARLLDGLDDARCAPLLETFWWLASAEDVLERWDPCVRHAERGIALARRFGVSFVFVALTHTLAVTLGWQGRLRRARDAAAETIDASHLAGNPSSLTYAYTTLCFFHTQAGEASEAVTAGEQAVELAADLPAGLFVSLPHANLGAALLAAGEPERARAQLLAARSRGALEHWVGRFWWERWMAEAELALGRAEEAEQWLEAAERTADEMGLEGRRGSARAVRAALLLARGDSAAASQAALAAAGLLEGAGRPADGARARLLAGRAQAAAGGAEAAAAELERARGILLEAGAPRLADEAARELRRLGRRVSGRGGRSAAANGIGSLSERERQVAELVAAGRTNGDIAAALHLSEKTVANNLTRIYGKLEISSRSALAATVARESAT